jgi:hypothetical protein
MVEDDRVDGGSDPVVLGRELAAARATEDRHVPPGPSPIADIDYPAGSGNLWRRWVELPQDAAMSVFIGGYAAAAEPDRVVTRASLTMDDLYTVLLFAERRAFAAIHTGDPAAAVEAFDALSAIDTERVDWRDVTVTAMLAAYAASHAGMPAVAAAEGAIGRADPQVAKVLSRAADDEEIDLAKSCGYRVVATADGPALFEDGGKSYEPDRDLVPIALGVAAVIEGERTYRVQRLSIGKHLSPVWVAAETDERVAAAVENLTGCGSVHAAPLAGTGRNPGDHFLTVYLAEAATAEDAAVVAEGATRGGRPGSVGLGVAAGRLCAVFVAACVVADEPSFESAESLTRFQAPVAALLG